MRTLLHYNVRLMNDFQLYLIRICCLQIGIFSNCWLADFELGVGRCVPIISGSDFLVGVVFSCMPIDSTPELQIKCQQ